MVQSGIILRSYLKSAHVKTTRVQNTHVFSSLAISSNLLKIIIASAVSRVLQNQTACYIRIQVVQ